MRLILTFICFLFLVTGSFAQSTNDILGLLVTNNTITRLQSDSLRAESAIKQQETDASKKSFMIAALRQMQLSGYTLFRYQWLDEKGKNDGFDIRRARLDLKGSLTPFFAYRLQTEFADKPKLIDAYAEIKLVDFLIITVGQFKIPFSMENLASASKFEMIDKSQVVEALVARSKDVIGNQNGRDIGIQASGTIMKFRGSPFIEYRIGIFNGSGINVADTANEAKDIAGRLNINIVKGLSIASAYYLGWDKAIKPDINGLSQTRNRLGFDVSYVLPRLSLRGEYIWGKDGKTDRAGWYAQAGYYIIPQKLQVVARCDTYDPDTKAGNNLSTNYALGGNFNFNSWSRIQAFYTFREEQTTQITNNYFSIQYQIGF
jgi:phosphate-selective porin OprO and OprP